MRGRSARRIRELTSSPEFVDAFVESALPLSTRRALRQTSLANKRRTKLHNVKFIGDPDSYVFRQRAAPTEADQHRRPEHRNHLA
mgnify:CR=1 FL=1